MKTTVDIDDAVLNAAEKQARQQGKPLGVLIEEALRMTVRTAADFAPTSGDTPVTEGLDDNDPFFAALDEIRAVGRLPAPHREIKFP